MKRAAVSPVYRERNGLARVFVRHAAARIPCTYFEYDLPDRTTTLSYIDGPSTQRIGCDCEDLTLKTDGIAIDVLGLHILSLLLIKGGSGRRGASATSLRIGGAGR